MTGEGTLICQDHRALATATPGRSSAGLVSEKSRICSGGARREVVELKRQGLRVRAISRLTGYNRTTVIRYLAAPTLRPVYGPRVPAPSTIWSPISAAVTAKDASTAACASTSRPRC